MNDVYAVEFKEGEKLYNFINLNLSIKLNDEVVVETEKGLQFGKIIKKVDNLSDKEIKLLKKIVRIATKKDYETNKKNLLLATESIDKANKLAKKENLDMNFVNAVVNLDRSQMILFFLSTNRVDFRKLAKELGNIYRTRIELRQIGIRDKAKNVSGLGVCGRKLCCSSFLDMFEPVSISMAKNQNIALNPSKINGQCGRLLCCLNYENKLYNECKKDLPKVGNKVNTEKGEGFVISVSLLNKSYVVLLKNNEKIIIKLNDFKECEKDEEYSNK